MNAPKSIENQKEGRKGRSSAYCTTNSWLRCVKKTNQVA